MLGVIEEEKDHSHPYGPFKVGRRCVCRAVTVDTVQLRLARGSRGQRTSITIAVTIFT